MNVKTSAEIRISYICCSSTKRCMYNLDMNLLVNYILKSNVILSMSFAVKTTINWFQRFLLRFLSVSLDGKYSP